MARITRVAGALGIAMAAGWLLPTSGCSAAPASQTPPQTVPQAEEGSGSGEPLGDQLERSNGIIRPPSGVDPGLTQSPPEPGGRTPVIPPPGTPGDERGLNPK